MLRGLGCCLVLLAGACTSSPPPVAIAEPSPVPGVAEVPTAPAEHPLALGILDGSDLNEPLGHEWELTFSQVRDGDDVYDDYCNSGSAFELVDAVGIDLFYETPESSAIGFLLRDGPNTQGLYDVFAGNFLCDRESGSGEIVAGASVVGADDHLVSVFVNTLREDFDQHVASAVARRGDLVLSANWLSESFEEAESNAIGLAAVLSLMLERLPES